MTDAADFVLSSAPSLRGHFLLESGYHTDQWLTLDALFINPARMAPMIAALAERLRPYGASGICGPLLGGAFLAHALATSLGVAFYHAVPIAATTQPGLFKVEYALSRTLRRLVRGQRVAVVDEVISAGSAVRATIAALAAADAPTIAVGTFLLLGDAATHYFVQQRVPLEALGRRHLAMWKPEDCPLCRAGDLLDAQPH